MLVLGVAFNAAVHMLLPIGLIGALVVRLGVPGRYVAIGAVTWISAVPAIWIVPFVVSVATGRDPVAFVVALSLTAGITEELSRYLYYRFALRDRGDWRAMLALGAAHGGIESLWFGLPFLFVAVALALGAPPLEGATAADQVQLGLSRAVFVLTHMALASLVWRAVTRSRPVFLAAAIVAHVAVDLVFWGIAYVRPDLFWLGRWFLVALTVGAGLTLASAVPRQRLAPGSAA
jgi:uncharacterized membrane protein YhfC